MFNTLPSKIDLREKISKVYNQGQQGSCGPHAISACLDILYERDTGIPHRFDKQSIYENCHAFMGVWGDQYGINWPSVEYVSKNKGFLCNSPEYDNKPLKGFEAKRVIFKGNGWDSFKQLLAAGIPLYISIRAGSAFMNTNNTGIPWQKHRWGNSIQTAIDYQFTHAVALVGYDDEAKCWLLENSWSDQWGDGGFFGIPYDQMQWFFEEAWHFSMLPIKTHKVEGVNMQVQGMFSSEAMQFLDKSKDMIKNLAMKELQEKGVQGLLDFCKAMGITDKHLEYLAGWERATIRNYKVDNPTLNWDGFHWEQI